MLTGIIDDIVREHVQQAAFQWLQRTNLAAARPPDMAAIADIDARLLANLDAVAIAGDAAWPFILDHFEDFPEAGELFVASHLAMGQSDARRIEHCLALAQQNPESRAGLVGAFAAYPAEVTAPTIRHMLSASSAVHRACAIDVLAVHKADAGDRLAGFLADPSAIVRASACVLATQTGRRNSADMIGAFVRDDDADLRFAAAEALARLGEPRVAVSALQAEVAAVGDRAEAALRVLSQTLPDAEFRRYLGALYKAETTRAMAVRGIGMTGERGHVDWLIGQMEAPETAVAAGESFLELCPHAVGEGVLFSDESEDFQPEFGPVLIGQFYPVAARVRDWMAVNEEPD